MKNYIGIDNGVSGTYCFMKEDKERTIMFGKMPIFSQQDYTIKPQNITRIDTKRWRELITSNFTEEELKNTLVVMERPMVNATMFKASISSVRSFEATIIVIESLGVPYKVIDSKHWQHVLLPEGVKDKKKASLEVGNKLHPLFTSFSHPDRDGLLIAEWARQSNL